MEFSDSAIVFDAVSKTRDKYAVLHCFIILHKE